MVRVSYSLKTMLLVLAKSLYSRVFIVLAAMVAATLVVSLLALMWEIKPAEAAFPGENGDFVYGDAGKLYTVPHTGGTPTEVAEDASSPTSGAQHYNPEFSADGKTIVYSASDGNDDEIFTLPATGGTATRVTDNATNDGNPTFSPDGKTIAYSSGYYGGVDNLGGEIFLTNADGSGTPTNLTNTPPLPYPQQRLEFSPAFSPDGKTIAYVQYVLYDDSYAYGMYKIPVTGGTPTPVPACGSNYDDLDFSPDGTKLVYAGGDQHWETPWNIYVTSLTEGGCIPLTNYQDYYTDPSAWGSNFSPDGSKVSYYLDSDSGTYTVPATGGEPTLVLPSRRISDWGVMPTTVDECTVEGTSGNDVLTGTSGDDVICGLGGNDTIKGLGGNDTLKGGDGNDRLLGGQGNDTVDGGPGKQDTASFLASPAAVEASLATNVATGEGSDTLVDVENLAGTKYADELTGSSTSNRLLGLGATDTLLGGGGADKLQGGMGNDTLTGGPGADKHYGEDGDDTLNSQDGVSANDTVDGGAGTDTCTTDATEASISNCP